MEDKKKPLKKGDKVFMIDMQDFTILETEVDDRNSRSQCAYFTHLNRSFNTLEVLYYYDYTGKLPSAKFVHTDFTDRKYMFFTTREKADRYLRTKVTSYYIRRHKEQADSFMAFYMESLGKISFMENLRNAGKDKSV